TYLLCVSTSELLQSREPVHSDGVELGHDHESFGTRGPRTRRKSCSLRDDHITGAGGSLHLAAVGGGHIGRCLKRIGAVALCHRSVWRDVLRSFAEHPRTGAAHGARCRSVQSLASGNVAWLAIDRRRCAPGSSGGTQLDAAPWQPLI